MLNDKYQNFMKHLYHAKLSQTDKFNLIKNIAINKKNIRSMLGCFKTFETPSSMF